MVVMNQEWRNRGWGQSREPLNRQVRMPKEERVVTRATAGCKNGSAECLFPARQAVTLVRESIRRHEPRPPPYVRRYERGGGSQV